MLVICNKRDCMFQHEEMCNRPIIILEGSIEVPYFECKSYEYDKYDDSELLKVSGEND